MNVAPAPTVYDYGGFKRWRHISGLILGLHPATKRRRYKLTLPLIGWAQN